MSLEEPGGAYLCRWPFSVSTCQRCHATRSGSCSRLSRRKPLLGRRCCINHPTADRRRPLGSLGWQARRWGRRPLLLIGFGALPIRALLFALTADPLFLVGLQLLDGISAAIVGVLTVLVTADLTHG